MPSAISLRKLGGTPRDLQIYDAGQDYLLGKTRGEFAEEYIRLFEIREATGDLQEFTVGGAFLWVHGSGNPSPIRMYN